MITLDLYLLEILLVLLFLQESEMQLGKTNKKIFLCIGFSSWDLIMLFVFSFVSNLQFMDILFRESHVIAFRFKEMDRLLFDLCFDCTFTSVVLLCVYIISLCFCFFKMVYYLN